MLFNSYEFIIAFLPIVFFIYFYLNKNKLTEASKALLVISSLTFYSWWNTIYLPLILISMLFNYTLGTSISKKKQHKLVSPKILVTIGILSNIALLGYFKYCDFFIKNINYIVNTNIPLLNLALPLAISFFTFQQIAYLIDSYKKETKEYNFLNYGLFVTFFPQLIAGPIVHHKEMMPQFNNPKNKIINLKNISKGFYIFGVGLFKKVIIADTFSIWATNGFDHTNELTCIEAWITSLSYSFQLYFDFSGYTDMAVGVALLFNIKLPINFNSPYKASNIQEFWRRWHITLSRFLKDYIYIPLGGNRCNNIKVISNLIITFLIGGIWHGAGWNFIFWGLLHGIALVFYRIWKLLGFKLNYILGWFITFNFVNIAWIFFRANNWNDSFNVIKGMLGLNGIYLPNVFNNKLHILSNYNIKFGPWINHINGNLFTPIWVTLGFIIVLGFKNSIEQTIKFKRNYKTAIFSGLLFGYSIASINKVSEFLYFNF